MKRFLPALALVLALTGCSIVKYSFSGTSIQADVRTICIPYVEYKALRVNPSLSADLTQALQDKYRKLTRLEQVDMDGDREVACEITGYDVNATAVTAEEVAAQNRLTVTVKCVFNNWKYPEDNLDKSFSAYADFDATQSLEAVEGSICEEIIDKLCEDIFNATVAQW